MRDLIGALLLNLLFWCAFAGICAAVFALAIIGMFQVSELARACRVPNFLISGVSIIGGLLFAGVILCAFVAILDVLATAGGALWERGRRKMGRRRCDAARAFLGEVCLALALVAAFAAGGLAAYGVAALAGAPEGPVRFIALYVAMNLNGVALGRLITRRIHRARQRRRLSAAGGGGPRVS